MRRAWLLLLLVGAPLLGQPTVFTPALGSTTACGPNGARHRWDPSTTDPAKRWGLCVASPADKACTSSPCSLVRVTEGDAAELGELASRCGYIFTPETLQRFGYDIVLTGNLQRFRTYAARNCVSQAATCPAGQSCSPPCPVCEACTACPTCGDAVAYTKDRKPEVGAAVEFWDRLLRMRHHGARSEGGLWVTQGGTFTDAQVYAWRPALPAPEVR